MKKISEILSLIKSPKRKRKPLQDDSYNPFASTMLSSGNITMGNLDNNGNLKLSLI